MINIGKVIYSKSRDLVGNRVFPLIAEQGTRFPFIVYRRTTSLPETTKDAFTYKLRNLVEMKIVTEKYDEGVEIAEKLFDRFDGLRGAVDDVRVVDTRITGLSEIYAENAYVQILSLQIDTD